MPIRSIIPAVFGPLLIVLSAFVSTSFAEQNEKSSNLADIFSRHNAMGTFALYDVTNDDLTLVNEARAVGRKIPASTFKIVNSLIALETKMVVDENEIVPYGGEPQPFKSWERDMSIRAGIKISNVPVFQELARRIGFNKYRRWLKLLNYGNGQTGQDIETFWLKGPLKISAIEQVKLLAKLAQKKLPLSLRSQSIVADIVRLERKGQRVLFGKTGWTSATDPQLGWFVGWVKNERGIFSFALNMDIASKGDAKKRKLIAKEFLLEFDVF